MHEVVLLLLSEEKDEDQFKSVEEEKGGKRPENFTQRQGLICTRKGRIACIKFNMIHLVKYITKCIVPSSGAMLTNPRADDC